VTNDKLFYQVIIVGGGPAGVATSLTLSSRGISNCIIEASNEPIQKPGEAIPPNAKPLLKQLGIDHLISDPKHKIYHGNKSCWGNKLLEQKEFIRDIHGSGALLDRLYFETQLRQLVVQKNGVFLAGFKLRKVSVEKQGIKISVENGSRSQIMSANYIVDATGRKASVCRQFGVTKETLDAQFAITFDLQLNSKIARQILVEATENGWWYAAPKGEMSLPSCSLPYKNFFPTETTSPRS